MTATSVDQLGARTATRVAVRTTPRRSDRHRPGLIDLPACMLPALLFVSALVYIGWSAWWF